MLQHRFAGLYWDQPRTSPGRRHSVGLFRIALWGHRFFAEICRRTPLRQWTREADGMAVLLYVQRDAYGTEKKDINKYSNAFECQSTYFTNSVVGTQVKIHWELHESELLRCYRSSLPRMLSLKISFDCWDCGCCFSARWISRLCKWFHILRCTWL